MKAVRIPSAVLAVVEKAEGSTPRDKGTAMLVTGEDVAGTIGGGRLEWMVVEKARAMSGLPSGTREVLDIPLGPEINQCCGGHVTISLECGEAGAMQERYAMLTAGNRPAVQIHGAGHTGQALARSLSLLPFNATLVDSRSQIMPEPGKAVDVCHLALPEDAVRDAPPGTAFVILTHSHDLDFLIAAEALSRGDAAYVGMIGSRTKRTVFERWLERSGLDRKLAAGLTCPIGKPAGLSIDDKRPEIIAALVAAELISVFSSR